ncbi:Aste57867_17533 [Aphanomyces stellatus]|uniref:Aste57867_17533 protein n=1 Tax=Aphanomyces stellatus TaxID=120398 RepID=A0A485L839_9STRA|nr:hypothetical protein As57867_017473 [Aphanomyces stellatus]VFT94286.1 Aste57867_17533 [Aphanomyces stellatus]
MHILKREMSILLSQDVLAVITSYQPGGMYEDMVVFAHLLRSNLGSLDKKWAHIRDVLSPWLAAHADFCRLPKHVASSQDLASVVMYHAIKSSDDALLVFFTTMFDRELFAGTFIRGGRD